MQKLIADKDYHVPSGCAVVGIMNQDGSLINGESIIRSIEVMHERSNGLGGGFAAYGIYPELPDCYAFHMMFETQAAKNVAEAYIKERYNIEKTELIPIRKSDVIKNNPLLQRYFVSVKTEKEDEKDFVVQSVMQINSEIKDAFVFSSGKNMGIFKGVGFPEDIGRFYRLEEYEAYTWVTHGRFPTNSVGWWGGAHPFGLLDWSTVHNGEISSYGINKRYLLNFGYKCTLSTDTEVIAYLFDLFVRKQGLDFETVAKIVAAPFWEDIERMPEHEKKFCTKLRIIYGSALMNGPFGIVVANTENMVGLNDRIKLRPLVAAEKGETLYLASEEAAIREICAQPDRVWAPKAGEPVIGRLKKVSSVKCQVSSEKEKVHI